VPRTRGIIHRTIKFVHGWDYFGFDKEAGLNLEVLSAQAFDLAVEIGTEASSDGTRETSGYLQP